MHPHPYERDHLRVKARKKKKNPPPPSSKVVKLRIEVAASKSRYFTVLYQRQKAGVPITELL